MEKIHSYDENKFVFHNYDAHVSKVQYCHMTSLSSLIEYFQEPIIDTEHRDLFLARAFFIWMAEMKRNPNKDMPYEIKRLLQNRDLVTYAVLCKFAGIQYKIIGGIFKNIGYIPGHNENDESVIQEKWITVYLNDKWHFIDPEIGLNKIIGHSREGEILLENEGKTIINEEEGSTGIMIADVDDFWFCLSPSIYINYCFPDDPEWQLLPPEKRLSKKEFLSLPYLRQEFFVSRLQLLSEQCGIIQAKNGKCTLAFGADKTESRYVTMSYRLALRKGTGDLTGIDVADLPLLVVYAPSINTFSFNIRFPVSGEYIFETAVSSPATKGEGLYLCSMFKIVCTEPDPNCKKLPLDTGFTGYGFGYTAIDFGLKNPSTSLPTVPIDCSRNDTNENETELIFQIDSDKIDEVEFYSEVIGDQKMINVVTKTHVDEISGKLHVSAGVKEEGEYTLSVMARDKQTDQPPARIVNYLLTTNSSDEDREAEIEFKKRKKELTLRSKLQELEEKKTDFSMKINEIELEIENLKKMHYASSTLSKTIDNQDQTTAGNISSFPANTTEIEKGSDIVSEDIGDDINSVVSKPVEADDRIAESVKHSDDIADSSEPQPTEYDDSDNIPAAKSEGESQSSTNPDGDQSKVCILL